MSANIYVFTLSLFFGTILLIFGMKYVSAIMAARARAERDPSYRTLAYKPHPSQHKNQTRPATHQADLATVAAKVVTIEHVLKQVE